ncbi:hypothetical protein LguiA_036101 [Lonicera macranthoides]
MAITEFLLFVLTATLGGMFLCGANDLITTIFVAPQCFSLCSYLLSGYTKKDVRSNEATMKYLLMGGASSSILVHGFSWLYGSSGGEIELQEIVNDDTWIEDPRLPFGNLTLHWTPSNSGNISLMVRAAVFFDALSFLASACFSFHPSFLYLSFDISSPLILRVYSQLKLFLPQNKIRAKLQ